MKIIAEIIVPDSIEDIRLYDYCVGKFAQLPSRKSVKKAIDKGCMQVNGIPQKTGFWLKGNEKITLIDPENKPPKPYELDLEIVFEDEYLIIVNKPAGLVVSGNQFKTLFNALFYNFTLSKEVDALPWPLPVHRIDQVTCGLVIAAKTKKARIKMGEIFEKREIIKTYHAIAMGNTADTFDNKSDIDAKDAFTQFSKIKTYNSLRSGHLSLLKINPKTGRRHQIRKHLAELKHPILGDVLYAGKNHTLRYKGVYLTASALEFKHPITEQTLKIEISIPKKYEKRLESEQKRWNYKNN